MNIVIPQLWVDRILFTLACIIALAAILVPG